jgi:hypothetical protein
MASSEKHRARHAREQGGRGEVLGEECLKGCPWMAAKPVPRTYQSVSPKRGRNEHAKFSAMQIVNIDTLYPPEVLAFSSLHMSWMALP